MSTFSSESFKPENLYSLKGRVAIVTGGATGIGLAQAQGLHGAGAKVYLLSRRGEVLADVVKKYGFAGYIEGDVTNKESIEKAVEEFGKKEEVLDILVSNAVSSLSCVATGEISFRAELDHPHPFEFVLLHQGGPGPMHFGADTSSPEGDTDPAKKHKAVSAQEYKNRIWKDNSFENWDEIFCLNSHSLLFVAVAFLPLLAKASEKGQKQDKKYTSTVISTSSISAFVKQSQCHYAYNASKAAIAHLTEAIAYEFTYSTTAKVRVNSVAPGVFPSQMTTNFERDEHTSKSNLDKYLPEMAIPVGRHGTDEEMGSTIQFLASNEYMHGSIVSIDGGFTMSEP